MNETFPQDPDSEPGNRAERRQPPASNMTRFMISSAALAMAATGIPLESCSKPAESQRSPLATPETPIPRGVLQEWMRAGIACRCVLLAQGQPTHRTVLVRLVERVNWDSEEGTGSVRVMTMDGKRNEWVDPKYLRRLSTGGKSVQGFPTQPKTPTNAKARPKHKGRRQ